MVTIFGAHTVIEHDITENQSLELAFFSFLNEFLNISFDICLRKIQITSRSSISSGTYLNILYHISEVFFCP